MKCPICTENFIEIEQEVCPYLFTTFREMYNICDPYAIPE